MTLSDLTPAALSAVARRLGSSVPYLRHLVAGRRRASIDFAVKIERASGGKVGRETLVAACSECKYRRKCMKGEKA